MPVPRPLLDQIHQLLEQERLSEALAPLQRAASLAPADWYVQHTLAYVLYLQGQHAKALTHAQRATALVARDAQTDATAQASVHALLGECHAKLCQFAPAMACFHKAIALDPANPSHHNALAVCLDGQGQHREAWEPSRRAYELAPDDSMVALSWARALQNHGRSLEAIEVLETALRGREDPVLLMLQAVMANYASDVPHTRHLAIHQRLGRCLMSRAALAPLAPPSSSPGPRLRVGVLSADLRFHSCAFFLRPLLGFLPRDRFEVHVFSVATTPDAATSQLRPHADVWQDFAGASPRDVAQAIRAADIDILLETGGYTAGSYIESVAFAPARACVSYLGYPCTTGLPAMGWRIVDALTDPPTTNPSGAHPSSDALHTETLVRMPEGCFVCYDPHLLGDLPPSRGELAHAPDPHAIRLGSFNSIIKVSPACVALWASVLHDLPGSTLTLKGHENHASPLYDHVRAQFAHVGIDPARILVLPRAATQREHLEAYANIDIALDTTPYAGTTTTCEALLMGVPVVTLAGSVHRARVGVSLLRAAGLPELIASEPGSFASIVRTLARNPAQLTNLHSSLRDRLRASSLCDGPAFGARMGMALQTIASHALAPRSR